MVWIRGGETRPVGILNSLFIAYFAYWTREYFVILTAVLRKLFKKLHFHIEGLLYFSGPELS